MPWFDDSGRLFGKVNIIDASLLVFLLAVAVGILAVQSGWHRTSGEVIEGETDIDYVVYLRNVKIMKPETLFEVGKDVAMTIRNQPRGDVKVVAVSHKPKQAIISDGKGGFTLVPDPDDFHGYDYLVTFRDHALVSKEGYVTNGVKVKTGMKILVEGFEYQVPGVIMDISAVEVDTPPAATEARDVKQPAAKEPEQAR